MGKFVLLCYSLTQCGPYLVLLETIFVPLVRNTTAPSYRQNFPNAPWPILDLLPPAAPDTILWLPRATNHEIRILNPPLIEGFLPSQTINEKSNITPFFNHINIRAAIPGLKLYHVMNSSITRIH